MTPEPQPVIWARLSPQGRGPTRTLDYATITGVAIAIADEEGLDAVSMRKVAGRMEHSTMSLYRHVGSKDDLTELMYDAVLGEQELPDEPGANWRTELAGLARSTRQIYRRHPWMIRLGQRPSLGPNSVRRLEYAIACLDDLGLDMDRMLDLAQTTLQFTQGFVQEEMAEQEMQQRTGMDAEAWRLQMTPYLTQLLETGNNPQLKRFILEAEDFPDLDVVFERRLTMVLDGLAASLAKT